MSCNTETANNIKTKVTEVMDVILPAENKHKLNQAVKYTEQSSTALIKTTGECVRTSQEKTAVYTEYLSEVFVPYPTDIVDNIEKDIHEPLNVSAFSGRTSFIFSLQEIEKTMRKEIKPPKSPGFDLILGKVVRELENFEWCQYGRFIMPH